MKLYEIEQPYHCTESNYFATPSENEDCYFKFNSFDEYLVDYSADELCGQMNLLFRWDWTEDDHLILHVFLQRKGFKITHDVKVKKSEEPRIREFLKQRSVDVLKFWENV